MRLGEGGAELDRRGGRPSPPRRAGRSRGRARCARPRCASAKPSSIASAASNSRSASGQRPPRSASTPRSWWISAERRSFDDGAVGAGERGDRGERGEGVGEVIGGQRIAGIRRRRGGGRRGPGPCAAGARRDAAPAAASPGGRGCEKSGMRFSVCVLRLGGEVPEVQVVEHEPHRLEEVQPLDLDVAVLLHRRAGAGRGRRPRSRRSSGGGARRRSRTCRSRSGCRTRWPNTCCDALPGDRDLRLVDALDDRDDLLARRGDPRDARLGLEHAGLLARRVSAPR